MALRKGLTVVLATTALTACATTQSPRPLDAGEMRTWSQSLRQDIARQSDPVTRDITLYEAMARALKNNLDHHVRMMEFDLARRDYDLSHYDKLPKIVANGGYYGRSNRPGASSRSLLSGRESLEPSTSTQQFQFTSDLSASWNVLDFGLASIRSKQLGNEALIVEERRRKAVIGIMEDVHSAYYRALSAERLKANLDALEADVRSAFSASRAQYDARRTAPMPALSYQRELTDIQAQAQRLSREMETSRMELASLMGLPPDQDFRLSDPGSLPKPGALAVDYSQMIDYALLNRPEIRENGYAQRIGKAGVRKAVLEALPSLEGFAGLNTSSNDFLFNKDWADYGLRASWNLVTVFQTSSRKKRAKAQLELERKRGLATAMAIMTQVGVARMRYESLLEEYDTANAAASVQSDITTQIEAQAQVQRASNQTLVRERMNRILASARRDQIHADLAQAAAHVYTALGYDPYRADVTGAESIQTLSASLQSLWTERMAAPGH